MMRGWLCAIGLLWLAHGFEPDVAGQQPRDVAAKPASGTALIAGRVMTSDAASEPVRRALVTLTGEGIPGGRTAISDTDGRFTFERLPAGRFSLSASKPAYLPGVFGATKPGRPGVPLQIGDSDQRTGLVLALAHGAAITGVVRDGSGEPAPGIEVAALGLPRPGSPPTLAIARSATTDDRGVYRLYGLMPGDYLVSSMMRPGVRTNDVEALSASQIDDLLLGLQRRSTTRGTAPPAPLAAAAPTYAYTPVFYPGTTLPDSAIRITLGVAEERSGIDFAVQLTRMATIDGELTEGGIAAKPLIINPIGLQMPALAGSSPTYSSQPTPSGRTFKYTNVVPGRYAIVAESVSGTGWARADVEVAGSDVSGVALVMQPALRLRGRIVFDGAALQPPSNPETVAVRLIAVRSSGQSAVGSTRMGTPVIPPGRVEADGRFEIGGIIPDVYRLTATVPGASGWWLRSAIVNGVDVLDHPLEIRSAGDTSGAVLTFSDRQTTVSGTIASASGDPAPAWFVAVFPADRSLWRPQVRRIQSARAATDGTWSLRGLPPGDYLVAALADLAPADLADPAFLEGLAGGAARMTLRDGEQKTVNLRAGGA